MGLALHRGPGGVQERGGDATPVATASQVKGTRDVSVARRLGPGVAESSGTVRLKTSALSLESRSTQKQK